jgi:hypothetical protein
VDLRLSLRNLASETMLISALCWCLLFISGNDFIRKCFNGSYLAIVLESVQTLLDGDIYWFILVNHVAIMLQQSSCAMEYRRIRQNHP